MEPLVSVLMGIYNCEATLSEAIDSILAQTYTNWELILCDDGSTDRTCEIAEGYHKSMPEKIVLLKHEKNAGLNQTLNDCLAAARGTYIARMDGDDISLPERFEKQVEYLDSHPEIAVVGTGYYLFDGQNIIGKSDTASERTLTDVYSGRSFAHPTVMMRKDALLAVGGYTVAADTRRAEDYDLWCKLYQKGYRGVNLPAILFKYREDFNAYKKRKFVYYRQQSHLIRRWYRALRVGNPLLFIRPILVGLTPKKIYIWRHRKRFV